MKYLVEITDRYSSISLLTDNHEEAMDMYNSHKESKQAKFTILSDKKVDDFLKEIDEEAYLAAPLFE